MATQQTTNCSYARRQTMCTQWPVADLADMTAKAMQVVPTEDDVMFVNLMDACDMATWYQMKTGNKYRVIDNGAYYEVILEHSKDCGHNLNDKTRCQKAPTEQAICKHCGIAPVAGYTSEHTSTAYCDHCVEVIVDWLYQSDIDYRAGKGLY